MEKKRYCMRRKTWRRATFPRWNLWPTDQPPSFRLSGAGTEIYSRVKSSTTVREGGRVGVRVGGGAGITRRTRPRERIHVKANGGARENEERISRTWAELCLFCYFIILFFFNVKWKGEGWEGVLSSDSAFSAATQRNSTLRSIHCLIWPFISYIVYSTFLNSGWEKGSAAISRTAVLSTGMENDRSLNETNRARQS